MQSIKWYGILKDLRLPITMNFSHYKGLQLFEECFFFLVNIYDYYMRYYMRYFAFLMSEK